MQPLKDFLPKLSQTLVSNAATTTSQKAQQSKTLAPSGGRGSTTISTTTAPDLGRALMLDDPSKTKLALEASLPRAIKFSLKLVFTQAGVPSHYELKGTHGPTEIAQATAALAQSLTPMSGNEALDLLTDLKSLTRPQTGQTTEDVKDQLKAYLKRVMEYPADVARHVLKTQPDMSPWWPSWQELKERLEIHTYRRRMMLTALKSRPSSTAAPREQTILDAD